MGNDIRYGNPGGGCLRRVRFVPVSKGLFGAGDAEKFSPFGRATSAASAALRAICSTRSTASWPDALRLLPARLVKCPGSDSGVAHNRPPSARPPGGSPRGHVQPDLLEGLLQAHH